MKPTDMASPTVNNARSCHFSGEERRARGEAPIHMADMVETARDKIGTIGTVRPDDKCSSIFCVHSGWAANRNTERAVTASCAERIAYTLVMKVWRDSRVRKESIFSLVASRSREAAASEGDEYVREEEAGPVC